MATTLKGLNSSGIDSDVTTGSVLGQNVSGSTVNDDDAVTVILGEEMSSLFSGLTKAEEVIVLAATVVGVFAVLALLLRVTMPLVRRKKAQKAESEGGDSSTWSTAGSVGPDSLTGKEHSVDSWGIACSAHLPPLPRLEPLNLEDVYVDNWKKSHFFSHPPLQYRLEPLNLEDVYVDNWKKSHFSHPPLQYSQVTETKAKY